MRSNLEEVFYEGGPAKVELIKDEGRGKRIYLLVRYRSKA